MLASLDESQRARRVARTRGLTSARYADYWLECALLDADARLSPLIAKAMEVTRDSPELARTVEAFGDAGFKLVAAGKRLYLHPNSMSYRLKRWRELTGLDPHTLNGLALSFVAIARARDLALNEYK